MAKRKESTSLHLLSGSLADAIVHPIDTIRARLQTQKTNTINFDAKSITRYKNGRDALFKIVRHEGFFALYKGFSAVAMGTIPGHALYFWGYELSKKFLNRVVGKTQDNNPLIHFTSGIIADVFGSFAWCPQDVIKQRLQVQRKILSANPTEVNAIRYTGVFNAVSTIIREEGFRGLFRGYWTALATFAPYVGLYFVGYEQLKIFWRNVYRVPHVSDLPFYIFFLSAAASSAVSAVITCPLDVVKTRLQVHQSGMQYKNAFDAFRTIYRTEGVNAFFKGVAPRSLWMAGGTSLTMLAYEECKKALSKVI